MMPGGLAASAAARGSHGGRIGPRRAEPGMTGVGVAISMFVRALAGWEVGTHISGEFCRPRRETPFATGIALVIREAS